MYQNLQNVDMNVEILLEMEGSEYDCKCSGNFFQFLLFNILIEPRHAKRDLRVILTKCLFFYFLYVHYLKIDLWNFEKNICQNKLCMG